METKKRGRPRGRRKARPAEGSTPRPRRVGVRLTEAEYARLLAQSRLDQRTKAQILRDWFTGAAAPKEAAPPRIMTIWELGYYRQLLELAATVCELAEQAQQGGLQPLAGQLTYALTQLIRTADALAEAALPADYWDIFYPAGEPQP